MDYINKLKELLIRLRKLLFKIDKLEKIKECMPEGEEEVPRYPHNEKRFPNNIYPPDKVVVKGSTYTRYRAKFNNLHDLYDYLSSEPKINDYIFQTLHSVSNDSDFAGVSFSTALEELMEPPRVGFKEFVRLSDALNEEALGYVKEFEVIKSPGGGYVDIPSYAQGDPLCYRITRTVYSPKFIRINIALSYYWGTTKNQVLNRALIISSLVNAFEQAGYVVEVNTYEVSTEGDELIDIDVNIKNSNETFNRASLYKSLCYVEFLRRLLFRVLETLNVKNDWQNGYGSTCSEDFVRALKQMDENDIFFDQPREMGIKGENIASDFARVVANLNLEDKIDVKKAQDDLTERAKMLRKTIR